MKWFIKCIKNYANFTGRARRAEYWYFVLFSLIFGIAASVLDKLVFGYPRGVFYFACWLFLIIPSIAVWVRRLHDTGRSGRLVLWYYVAAFVWAALLFVTGATLIVGLFQGGMPSNAPVGFLSVLGVGTLGFFVWAVFFLVWCCQPGDKGDNKYGRDPLAVTEL